MMSQQSKVVKVEIRVCDLCKEVGRVEAVEMLPGGGILFECNHDSGKHCEWAVYEGFENLRNAKTERMLTPEIKCPKCNEMGVVKTERDDSRRPDRYSYRISHPAGPVCRLAGKDRDIVLKLLGRYIPKTEEKRAYVGRPVIRCPICNENGSYAVYDGIPMVCHYVKGKGTIQHRMRTTLRRLQAETAANKQIITQKDQIIAQKNQKIEQLQRDKAEERAQDLKFFQSMHERTTNYLKKKMERQSQAQ